MPVIDLLIWLVLIAVLVVITRMAMPESAQPIKRIIIWTLAAIAIYLVLAAFGVIDALRGLRTPRL